MTHLINQLMNDRGVFRTAPDTQGVLKITGLVLNKSVYVFNMTVFSSVSMTGFVLNLPSL